MGNEFWTVAASIAQIVAAAASVCGLYFVGAQIRASNKTADIQALQEFSKQTIEREHRFLNATNAAQKEQAFIEFINFLEMYAAALNGNLVPPVSRKIVSDSVVNSIAAIQMAPAWASKFEDAIRTATTFDELGRFMRSNRPKINCVTEEMHRVQPTS